MRFSISSLSRVLKSQVLKPKERLSYVMWVNQSIDQRLYLYTYTYQSINYKRKERVRAKVKT